MRVRDYQKGYNISEVVSKIPTPTSAAVEIGPPMLGLNFRLKPIDIAINETSYCKNARIWRNYIEPRPGLTLLASGFDDTIMYIREFVTSADVNYLIVITLKSLYYSLNLTTFARLPWYYSTGTVTTSASSPTVTGSGTTWATNARAGDRFKCDADDTWKTIKTVDTNTQITLTANYGADRSGVTYKIDRYFSGDTSNTFWGVTIADVDYFCFSQGIDPVLYVNVDVDQVRRLSADCPSAKNGTLFADRLIIGNLTNLPFRTQWCARGSYTDWTGTGSGFKDWVADPQEITGLSVAQGILVLYKSYSIGHMTQTGRSDSPFNYDEVRVPAVGLYYPSLFFSIGDADIIASSDNFYSYDTRNINAIGDDIKDNFLQRIDPSYIETAHALVAEEFAEAQLYFPTVDNTTPNIAWVYNYGMNIFSSEWDLAANASGYATQKVSESWDAAVGSWDSDTDIWDSSQILASTPLNIIAKGTDLYKLDTNALTDAGTEFTFEWWTKELGAKDFKVLETKQITIMRVVVFYYCSVSSTLNCSLSGDGGKTFTTEKSASLTYDEPDKLQTAFFSFNHTYDTVIVRFRASNSRFQIVRVRVEGIAVGDIIS